MTRDAEFHSQSSLNNTLVGSFYLFCDNPPGHSLREIRRPIGLETSSSMIDGCRMDIQLLQATKEKNTRPRISDTEKTRDSSIGLRLRMIVELDGSSNDHVQSRTSRMNLSVRFISLVCVTLRFQVLSIIHQCSLKQKTKEKISTSERRRHR